MERRSTRSMRSSSMDEEHETTPSRKTKQATEDKSASSKKGQSSQKGASQSSGHEASQTGGSLRKQKTGEHTSTDEAHEDKKHGRSTEKKTDKKGSENIQKEKHDNDYDDAKSKPSVSRVISSKHTPQQRKGIHLSSSKKKVQGKSPGALLEIRSSTSPFKAETLAEPKPRSSAKSEISRSAEKNQEQGKEGSKSKGKVDITVFSPRDTKDSGNKGSAQQKGSEKGSTARKGASQEEILADRMVGEDPTTFKEKKDTNVDRTNQLLHEDDSRFNRMNEMFVEEHKVEERQMVVEQESGTKSTDKKSSIAYQMAQKLLQSEQAAAQGLGEHIRRETPDKDQENQESRQKYSVGEDLRIIEYVNSKLGSNLISKNFWKAAYEDGLLDKRRSVDSMRDRYRNHLRYLSIDDCDRMKEWLVEHDEKGFANFIRKAVKDPSGKIIYVKKLDGIESDVGTNQTIAIVTNKEKKPKTDKPAKPRGKSSKDKARVSAQRQSDYEEDDIESVHEDEYVPVQRKEPVRAMPQAELPVHQPRKQFVHLEEELAPRLPEKRKGYEAMYHIDAQMLPRKVTRDVSFSRPDERFFSTQEEERLRDKETWLREQAMKHSISPDQMKSLFFRCSMNSLILDRYFRGEHNLIWDKDEDDLLTGPYKDVAKRVLSHYKGSANVRQREEFLTKFEHLYSMRGNLAQKQSSNFGQMRRSFF